MLAGRWISMLAMTALFSACSGAPEGGNGSSEEHDETADALVSGRDPVRSSVADDTPILSSLPNQGGNLPGGKVILESISGFSSINGRVAASSEWFPTLIVPGKITASPKTHLPSLANAAISTDYTAPGTATSVGASAAIVPSALPLTTPQVQIPTGAVKARARLQLSAQAPANIILSNVTLSTSAGTNSALYSASDCTTLAPKGAWTATTPWAGTGTGACSASAVKPSTDAAGLTTWDVTLPVGAAGAYAWLSLGVGIDSSPSYGGRFDLEFLNAGGTPIGAPSGATWPILAEGAGHFAANMDPRYGEPASRVKTAAACTRAGTGPVVDPGGKIDCYPLVIHTATCLYDARSSPPGDSEGGWCWPHTATALLAVDNSGPLPKVAKFVFDSPRRADTFLSTVGGVTQPSPLTGFEITATADSRLLVYADFNGLQHAFAFNPTPWNPTTWSAPAPVAAMPYSKISFCLDGTSTCATPTKLTDYYPLAHAPWKLPDGTTLKATDAFTCAYPWLAFDGSLLFCRVLRRSGLSVIGSLTNHVFRHIDGPLNRLRDNQQPGCNQGSLTLNVGDLCGGPTRSGSFGRDSGLWGTFPNLSSAPLPFTRRRPLWTLLEADNESAMEPNSPFYDDDYGEVAFDDAADGRYLAYLHMNESFTMRDNADAYYGADRSFAYDDAHTPDTSGNLNNGVLRGGAMFPFAYNKTLNPGASVSYEVGGKQKTVSWNQEWDWFDTANPGRIGRSIFFPDGSDVLLANNAGLNAPRNALSVELFVNPLLDVQAADAGTQHNDFRYLVNKPGSFDIILEANRTISASVYLTDPATQATTYVRAPFVGPTLPLGGWSHVAMVYNANDTTTALRVYVNGVLATSGPTTANGQTVSNWGPVLGSSADLVLGPGVGMTYDSHLDGVVLSLDEVTVSSNARTALEIAQAAYLYESRTYPTTTVAAVSGHAPLGLVDADVRVPSALVPLLTAGTLTKYASIGGALFQDPELSRNVQGKSQGVSCASCHVSASAFTDGRTIAEGVAAGTRNTPTALNRAFSTYQFFDGRANDLVAQALAPLANPTEMNSDMTAVLSYLNSSTSYPTMFANAGLTGPIDQNALVGALAANVLGLVSGDAPIDQLQAGAPVAAAAAPVASNIARGSALFNGKARCAACHTGANFSDELFHNTGSAASATDVGRGAFDGSAAARYAFKTPSLRNIAVTAPYFHDGSRTKLSDVIGFYACGGVAPVGGTCPAPTPRGQQDAEIHPLSLTAAERTDLALFLTCGLLDTVRFPSSLAAACTPPP